jgi:hypothetical protein
MYFNDHAPPHFHAEYGEYEAVYTIEGLEVLRGHLPRRAHSMAIEWASINRQEIRKNWDLAQAMQPLAAIAPLQWIGEQTMKELGPRVRIRKAAVLSGFRIRIEFDDETEKEVDLEPFLRGEIFAPIRQDRSQFEDIRIEGGTIAWSNGADIDPDVLYYELKPAWMEESVPDGQWRLLSNPAW